jgi:hypothetical protein
VRNQAHTTDGSTVSTRRQQTRQTVSATYWKMYENKLVRVC